MMETCAIQQIAQNRETRKPRVKSLRFKILPLSHLRRIFCAEERRSEPGNCRRINTLQGSIKKIWGGKVKPGLGGGIGEEKFRPASGPETPRAKPSESLRVSLRSKPSDRRQTQAVPSRTYAGQ